MTQAEFQRWAAYEAEEPFLPARVDLIGGLICSVLANVNKAKHVAAFTPLDFMPILERMLSERDALVAMERNALSPADETERTLQMAVLKLGGRVHGARAARRG